MKENISEYMNNLLIKIQTLSIVAGTMACNAKCPDCVSKMTTNPSLYKGLNFTDVEWDHFDIALAMAKAGKARAVLFTGKGETTLFPEQINKYLLKLPDKLGEIYIGKEIQTNGIIFQNPKFTQDEWLKEWRNNGLDTISLSVVDVDDEVNRKFYLSHQEKYPELVKTINMIHNEGYKVRLSVTMIKNMVDGPDDIERVVEYCKKEGIEQLSVRPMRKPGGDTYCPSVAQFVLENELSRGEEEEVVRYVEANKDQVIERLMHGAVIYKLKGQNICLTDCITERPKEVGSRQLIFYSNGMLTDGWTENANTILGIGPKCREYLKK
jgi:pyruvate-formate lyase-activating enzyme